MKLTQIINSVSLLLLPKEWGGLKHELHMKEFSDKFCLRFRIVNVKKKGKLNFNLVILHILHNPSFVDTYVSCTKT